MVPEWPRMIQDSPRLTQQDGTGKLGMSAGVATLTQSEYNKLPKDKKHLVYNPFNLMADSESASKTCLHSTFETFGGPISAPENVFLHRIDFKVRSGMGQDGTRMTQDGPSMVQHGLQDDPGWFLNCPG